MKRLFRQSVLLLSLAISSFATVFAWDLPFSDVKVTDDYYNDLKTLYERGIILESPTGKFFPEALMNRDEFVSIVVGVSCKRCLTPTFEDIMRYTEIPFVDFDRKNVNFYCVSYAKEQKIIEGYVVEGWSSGSACQDGTTFSQTPFCANNKITRIEAAAVLLRQAWLWNDELNSWSFAHRQNIADVDQSWYGYAQKGIDAGIIAKDSENKIRPNEYLTKREFVMMASKIFAVNLCSLIQWNGNANGTSNTNASPNTLTSEIRILDKSVTTCSRDIPQTTFPDKTERSYTFSAVTESTGNLEYSWEFVRTQDGKKMTASGACLKSFALDGAGTWLVRLTVRDKDNGRTSTSLATVEVRDASAIANNQLRGLSVTATANMLTASIPQSIKFTGLASGGVGPYTYRWDFADGSFSTEQLPIHLYERSGVLPVTLTARDSQWSTAIAQLVLVLTASADTDKDGILNPDDRCPLVAGPRSNFGCPLVAEYDGGGEVPGFVLSLGGVGGQCYFDRAQSAGAIFGAPTCTSCPCDYRADYVAQVRSCDVIVPTILSPDKSSIYSRGKVFELRF